MENQSKKIMTTVASMERGTIFFPSDLSSLCLKPKLVNKVLERATVSNIIVRLATGVYCFPRIDEKYGLGIIYPSYEDVVKRIAERDNVKLAPTGASAQNILGLSTQVPMKIAYLTDGRTKTIKFSDGYVVKMFNTSKKNLAFKNRLIQLLTLSLKDIGEDNVTDEQTERIRQLLSNIPLEQIKDDLRLMPCWIRNFILKLYE